MKMKSLIEIYPLHDRGINRIQYVANTRTLLIEIEIYELYENNIDANNEQFFEQLLFTDVKNVEMNFDIPEVFDVNGIF